MPIGYRCLVQDTAGAVVIASERRLLDSIRVSQWLSVQAAEALPGDVIVIVAQDTTVPMPNPWPVVYNPADAAGGGGNGGGDGGTDPGTGGNTPTPLPASFEAETGTLSGGAAAAALVTGFTGAGYVQISGAGASVAFPSFTIGGS